MLEFVYTFFVVTAFIWVISLYISVSIHWQNLAKNQLIALSRARNSIEQELIRGASAPDGVEPGDGFCIINIHKQYPMPMQLPHFQHNELPIESFNVSVSWNDDRGNSHALQLQTYS